MKKKLFIIGTFTEYAPKIYETNLERWIVGWEFHTLTCTEEDLLKQLCHTDWRGKSLHAGYLQRGLRAHLDNCFICQFDDKLGRINRQDIVDKVIAELDLLKDPSETGLVDLDLSVRALNVLKDLDIRTIKQLAENALSEDGKFIGIKAKNAGKLTNNEYKQMLILYRMFDSGLPSKNQFC